MNLLYLESLYSQKRSLISLIHSEVEFRTVVWDMATRGFWMTQRVISVFTEVIFTLQCSP